MKPLLALITLLSIAGFALIHQRSDVDLASLNIPNVFSVGERFIYVQPSRTIFEGSVARPQMDSTSQLIAFIGDPTANRQIPFTPEDDYYEANAGSDQGLYVYDLRTKNLQLAAKLPSAIYDIAYISWVSNTSTVLCQAQREGQQIGFLYNASTKRITNIPKKPFRDHGFEPMFFEGLNCLVYHVNDYEQDEENSYLYVLNLQTNRWQKTRVADSGLRLYSDGKRLIAWDYGQNEEPRFFEINPFTGQVTPIPRPERPEIIEQELSISVSNNGPEIVIGAYGYEFESFREDGPDEAPKRPIRPPAYLTKTGIHGGIAPNEKNAWYTDRSGLHLCGLVPLTAAEFEKVAIDYVKKQAMSQAKQVGIGMIIYSSDYDDRLPFASNWRETLAPYVRNNSLFSGFTYLLNGEDSTKLGDVSNTDLGLVETPFGTAIVRLDGSVIWKDRPRSAQAESLEELRN